MKLRLKSCTPVECFYLIGHATTTPLVLLQKKEKFTSLFSKNIKITSKKLKNIQC